MRVTEPAQRATRQARKEALRLGHDRVGTEHLLLAVLADREGLAVAALGELGIPLETVRGRVEEAAGPGRTGGEGRARDGDGKRRGWRCSACR
jgi:ATP-dependent Clp protease ATP-binding subunit ClpA